MKTAKRFLDYIRPPGRFPRSLSIGIVAKIDNSEVSKTQVSLEIWADEIAKPVFEGCVTATTIDNSRIKIDFSWPENSNSMRIVRNGQVIYETFSKADISFVDTGLSEGKIYNYVCKANINGVDIDGIKIVSAETFLDSVPDFDGIDLVIGGADGRTVTARWKSSKEEPAPNRYDIYTSTTPGASVLDYSLTGSVGFGTYFYTLSDLGFLFKYQILHTQKIT